MGIEVEEDVNSVKIVQPWQKMQLKVGKLQLKVRN